MPHFCLYITEVFCPRSIIRNKLAELKCPLQSKEEKNKYDTRLFSTDKLDLVLTVY